ncbi:unnamed protein product [Didymodactylos carnosus]|uniref:TIR domain-containing protein n=1 Tax=Didymodactylos carnosus TaxID=1234261 RepID=A0A815IAN5_9BILA|nr:unnamed protein product [Didymodactylos carnosus]CAF4243292.1 unnamed protein product [Didymodactylos carnosus]
MSFRTTDKQQQSLSKDFNAPEIFKSLKSALNPDVIQHQIPKESIHLACVQLRKNWSILLDFTYINTTDNEKEHNVTSLIYIIKTVVEIVGHNDLDENILYRDSFAEFVRILPKLAMLESVSETFSQDSKFAREIFYQLFQLINDSSYLRTYIEKSNDPSYIETLNADISYRSELYDIVLYVIFLIAKTITSSAKFRDNDLDNFKKLFETFRIYVDYYFENTQQTFSIPDVFFYSDPRNLIICEYLSILWNLADKPSVVRVFINTGYPKAVLNWILISELKYEHRLALINIARDSVGENILKENHAVDILRHIKDSILGSGDSGMDLIYYMAVILLSEHYQIEEALTTDLDVTATEEAPATGTSMKKVISYLYSFTIYLCKEVIQNNVMSGMSFHLSELVVVLERVFIHDSVIDYLMTIKLFEIDHIELFCDTLIACRGAYIDGDKLGKLACVSLINIIWSLSFYDDSFRECLLKNVKLIIVIQGLAHCNTQAAKCILCNLKLPITTETTIEDHQLSDMSKPLVLISHSFNDRSFVERTKDELKQKYDDKYIIYPLFHTDSNDLSELTAKPWEQTAAAIEKAVLVLFVISKHYYESKSCRQTAMYVLHKEKRRIILCPNNTEENYCSKGWLDSLAGQSCECSSFIFPDGHLTESKQEIEYKEKITKLANEISSLIEKDKKPNRLTTLNRQNVSSICTIC